MNHTESRCSLKKIRVALLDDLVHIDFFKIAAVGQSPTEFIGGMMKHWYTTEQGQWVKSRGDIQPEIHVMNQFELDSYRCLITLSLTEQDFTFFQLKWGTKPLTAIDWPIV